MDPNDRQHLIFGGGNIGFDPVLSLHETRDHGLTLLSILPPRAIVSPEVQQLLATADGSLLVLISEGGATGLGRELLLFRSLRN